MLDWDVSLLLSWAGVAFGLLSASLQFRNARRLHNMRSSLRYIASALSLYCAIVFALVGFNIDLHTTTTILLRPALIAILALLAAFAIVEI